MMKLKGDMPPVGSLILTVVVVVVAIAILMTQVLKIDIAGFLQKKFGVEEIPVSGYALHVRLDTVNSDPNNQNIKVYDFHLTDALRHPECDGECAGLSVGPVANNPSSAFDFYVAGYNPGQCAIFTTNDYRSGPDSGRIYYVSPGSKVQDRETSIRTGVNILSGNGQNECNLVSLQKDEYVCKGNNCKKLTKPSSPLGPATYDSPYPCARKFNLAACGSTSADNFLCEVPPTGGLGSKNKMVIDAQFADRQLQSDDWGCTSSCNLLVDKQYEVKYGLICGNDAKWHTCSDKNPDSLAGVDCKTGSTFTWEGNLIVGTLSRFSDTPNTVNQEFSLVVGYKGTGIKSVSLNLDDIQPKPNCKFSTTNTVPESPSSYSADGRIWTYKEPGCTNPAGCSISGISIVCSTPESYQFQAKINDNNQKTATTNVLKVLVHQIGTNCGPGLDC